MDNLVEEESSHIKYTDVAQDVDNFIEDIKKRIILREDLVYQIDISDAQDLVLSLSTCKLPRNYFSYKDLLREKLAEKFKLDKNDIVLFLEDGIYIKFFKQIENKNAKDRRACGIAPEVLEEYKEKHFPNDLYIKETFDFLPYVIEDILSYKKLNPTEFKKVFIHTLVNMIEIIVIKNMQIKDLLIIRGMSFFLLRQLFDDIMLFISEDILFNFAKEDKKAGEFLSYFSTHEIIDKKGNRHKANPILDENKHVWNMTTIRSTITQHKRAKQAMYDKKDSLLGIKKKLNAHRMDQVRYSKERASLEQKLFSVEKSLEAMKKSLKKIENTKSDKIKFVDNGKEKIFDKKPLLLKIMMRETEIYSQKTDIKKLIHSIDIKTENKQKDIDIWLKKYNEGKDTLANIEKTGHPADKQYKRISIALAKTLAKR